MNDEELTPEVPDKGTELAEERTDLAIKRTVIAAERTLMAWVRTSISMISFGFTIYKFFEYLIEAQNQVPKRLIGPQQLALFLISIGTLMLVAAIIHHMKFIKSLETPKVSGWSLVVIVAILTVLIGLWAFYNVLGI